MAPKLLCRICNSTVQSKGWNDVVYCECKRHAYAGEIVKGKARYRVKNGFDKSSYALIDDKGNEIDMEDKKLVKAETIYPEGERIDNSIIFGELMLSLDHQIEAMENLSQAAKFSPCVTQDLLAHLIWLQGLIKVLVRLPRKPL